MTDSELFDLLEHARVATLATIRADGRVDLVPVTFAFDDDLIVTAVDHKPLVDVAAPTGGAGAK